MGVVKTSAATKGRASAPRTADEGTRDHIARIVGQDGPITVALLAERLQLTTAAVRRHLDLMSADGLVDAREVAHSRRGPGRPARAYVLTERGQSQLAAEYDDLATQALSYLAEVAGPGAVRAFADSRADAMVTRLRPVVARAGDDAQGRVGALAAALRVEGYAASTRPVAQGTPAEAVQLCQGHCPVQHVAAAFPELCEAETRAFAQLLGVDVRRLATLAHGDHVCTTHIPVGPPENRRRTVDQRTTTEHTTEPRNPALEESA